LLFEAKSSTNAAFSLSRESTPMFLISPAYAQAAGDTTSTIMQMAPLALIFVVFYMFLIRPQQKKAKETRAMIEAIKRGDRVVTGGGIIGTVAKIANNDEVLVDIAENTRVRVLRATITSVLAKPVPASAKDDKDDEDEGDEEAAGEKSESAPPSGH
jgi:preprotein translocase subunit YajC